jgi:hypothetical protein
MWLNKDIFGLNRFSKILSVLIFSYILWSSQLALQYWFRSKIFLLFFNLHYEEYVSIPGKMKWLSPFQNCPTSLPLGMDSEDLSQRTKDGFINLATHCYLRPILDLDFHSSVCLYRVCRDDCILFYHACYKTVHPIPLDFISETVPIYSKSIVVFIHNSRQGGKKSVKILRLR